MINTINSNYPCLNIFHGSKDVRAIESLLYNNLWHADFLKWKILVLTLS